MTRPQAFFDVDCCEADESGAGLAFRPRVQPIAARVARLHAYAKEAGLPLVFTTCCSGRAPRGGELPGVLHIPRDPADTGWLEQVGRHRLFHIEKLTCGEPGANYAREAFNAFRHNPNAARMVAALDVAQWVVFGNGFDFCVNTAVRGLLAAGQRVLLLTDVLIASAVGYGASGTAENRARILGELRAMGVVERTLDEFLEAPRP